jgi:peptidoglycan hydrolase-like protein with peptidoglycan-binding domain
MQGLRNQVTTLESQVQAKDEEIAGLKESMNKPAQENETKESLSSRGEEKDLAAEVKSRPTMKQIQIALKNAGFDPGTIDGRMGKQTKDAIKAFQKEHKLPVDGKVGKRTWKHLRKYLSKKS